MNRLLIVACLLASIVAGAEPVKPMLDDLAWIAGCWETGTADHTVREQWMNPSAQTMLGMSHTVEDGKTVAYEFLRIHEEADGIYYTSIPSGQTLASFKLVKIDAGSATFENLQHDFPQRIIYRLDKDGGLMATIEGMSKGALKQVEFPMRKAPCE